MRSVPARSVGIAACTVMRVASILQLAAEWRPGLAWLVQAGSREELQVLEHLARSGLDCLFPLVGSDELAASSMLPAIVAEAQALESGDVVVLAPHLAQLQVLYRESDQHHTVFLTNRCNSYCLMCSQPPTRHDDSWLIDEALAIAAHIDRPPAVLGFTGGEPLLLGPRLRQVLTTFADLHPTTRFEVLTNGRLFHDRDLATVLLTGLPPRVWWMIPLYGHADFLHDYVVQTEGAFDQTIDGLLTLHEHGQSVQLRIVLIEPTLRILPELCTFIGKNLPFVRQVALMGCEPTGFALANRSVCEVNVLDWQESLTQAVQRLVRAGIPTALMNLPLCALPESLHPFAHRSISDWKRVYATACQGCRLQDDCCGLFASHKRGWEPAPLRAITEEATL